ncbi:hypothetical protein [Streptomyces sp. NPDC092307]|uniref:hypothetical protein n=1 Tax=Streptomyces sp. NPDC092307 TaxID=3366013 RepID=UPI00380AA80A
MPREGIVAPEDQDRFVRTAGRLGELATGELTALFPAVDTAAVARFDAGLPKGLF